MNKKFYVNYYVKTAGSNEHRYTHGYNESWDFIPEIYCIHCGANKVWVNTEGDIDAGLQYICTACGRSFYVSDEGYNINIECDEQIQYGQDKQRLQQLRADRHSVFEVEKSILRMWKQHHANMNKIYSDRAENLYMTHLQRK